MVKVQVSLPTCWQAAVTVNCWLPPFLAMTPQPLVLDTNAIEPEVRVSGVS
jgi:hypothetical protein